MIRMLIKYAIIFSFSYIIVFHCVTALENFAEQLHKNSTSIQELN